MPASLSQMAMTASAAVGMLLSVAGSAGATGFDFETQIDPNNNQPYGDVFLESVKIGDQVIDEFIYVSEVEILQNDQYLSDSTTSGGASADKGDEATTGVYVEDSDNGDLLENLASSNLNNIVDGEDAGSFVIDLTFSKVVKNLLFWERGLNSKLDIQAVDNGGNLIGTKLTLNSNTWQDAGFDINTNEIEGTQSVGSLGINILDDLGIEGGITKLRVSATGAAYNGPDWKVVGMKSVPEPTAVLGLMALTGALAVSRSRKSQADA